MMKCLRKALAGALTGTAIAILPYQANATMTETWPDRPITMIVPFPAGGPTDIVARVLATRLAEQLGQTVVVQNMPGANGVIGMKYAASARPDGHTILYNTSSIVLSPLLDSRSGINPTRDFVAVSTTAVVPLVLLTHPAVPVDDLKSFVNYAKERNGELSFASAGTGNVTHLTALLLLQSLDIRAVHIPYRGSAPALAELMGGETQFMTNPVSGTLSYVREGKLKAVAVTSRERVSALPGVPTIAELGIPDFESGAWQGVVVPEGTPPMTVERLNAEIRKALKSEDMQTQLESRGATTLGSSPQDYAQYIRDEYERWGALIEAADIRLD